MTHKFFRFPALLTAIALLAVLGTVIFSADNVTEADQPDDEVLKIVQKLLSERGGGVNLQDNSNLQLPDDPKKGISYRLDLVGAKQSKDKPKATIGFDLPVTDAHQNLSVQNKGEFALYTGDTYDIAVNASHSGFAAYVVIRDATAPTAYEFGYELPKGYKLDEGINGSIMVLNDKSEYIGFIEAPWAFDANGASVPTEFKLRDGALVQTVDHDGAAYPVVADPRWNVGYQMAKHWMHDVEKAWCDRTSNSEKLCVVAYGNHGAMAIAATVGRFQNVDRNNASDAFRHCYWAASMTIGMGRTNAEFFLNLHEQEPGQPLAERRMDEWNNAVGVTLGGMVSGGLTLGVRLISYIAAEMTCVGWANYSRGPLQLSLDDWRRLTSSDDWKKFISDG